MEVVKRSFYGLNLHPLERSGAKLVERTPLSDRLHLLPRLEMEFSLLHIWFWPFIALRRFQTWKWLGLPSSRLECHASIWPRLLFDCIRPFASVHVVCKSSLGPALGLFEFESSCRSDCLTGHGIVAFLIYLLWLLMDGFGRQFALGQSKMETHIMDRRPILLDRDIILFSMGFNESKKAH